MFLQQWVEEDLVVDLVVEDQPEVVVATIEVATGVVVVIEVQLEVEEE